ncbi:hypothetical protein CNY89_01995 [Amaricoccus sp. HAR-UPW-R2A-40]|nr:hypothetical protein CNY89_01995 [Amaricoccus sp. HAR-UPW-R2A-40]
MEEDLPILWIEGARALEGEYMVFTVRLSEPAVDAVTVNFRTLGGTALEESDVVSWGGDRLTGTLVFAPGEDVKTISVLVSNDIEDEIDENVLLEIHDPVGATFGGGAQTLTAVGWALDGDGIGADRAIAVSAPVVQEAPAARRSSPSACRKPSPRRKASPSRPSTARPGRGRTTSRGRVRSLSPRASSRRPSRSI